MLCAYIYTYMDVCVFEVWQAKHRSREGGLSQLSLACSNRFVCLRQILSNPIESYRGVQTTTQILILHVYRCNKTHFFTLSCIKLLLASKLQICQAPEGTAPSTDPRELANPSRKRSNTVTCPCLKISRICASDCFTVATCVPERLLLTCPVPSMYHQSSCE